MTDCMKAMLKSLPPFLLVVSAAGCSSNAVRPSAASAPSAPVVAAAPAAAAPTPPAVATAPVRELTDSTCAEYLDLVAQVKSESEATGPNAGHEAQDDLVSVMLWLHGYLSGRNGIDGQARPLSREWLASNVGVLARACAVDETRRVVDVVAAFQKPE